MMSFKAESNDGEINQLEISNSGQFVFASDDKGVFAAYNLLNKDLSSEGSCQLINIPNTRVCAQMSPDGQTFAIGSSNSDLYLSQIVYTSDWQ